MCSRWESEKPASDSAMQVRTSPLHFFSSYDPLLGQDPDPGGRGQKQGPTQKLVRGDREDRSSS